MLGPRAIAYSTLLLLSVSAPSQSTRGISRDLAKSRRETIEEVHYDLTFELDPARPDQVLGRAEIRFQLRAEIENPLVLDFDGNLTGPFTVNGKTDARIGSDANHLLIPAANLGPVGDANVLATRFLSRVAKTGTPLTRYRDAADDQDYFYTLVVPADAHRLFPCFDQPDLKAKFRLQVLSLIHI